MSSVLFPVRPQTSGGGGGPETDPIFGASEAASFVAGDKDHLDHVEADIEAAAALDATSKADLAKAAAISYATDYWLLRSLVPDIKLYLDPNHLNLADGAVIPVHTDFSGTENNSVQATVSKRPIFKTKVRNGLSIAQFDGVDDAVTSPGDGVFDVTKTVSIACRKRSAPNGSTKCLFSLEPTIGYTQFATDTDLGPGYFWYATASDGVLLIPCTVTNWHIVTAVFGDGTLDVYINGVLAASGTSNNYHSNPAFSLCSLGGTSAYGDFDIGDVIVSASSMGGAALRQLQRVMSRWL